VARNTRGRLFVNFGFSGASESRDTANNNNGFAMKHGRLLLASYFILGSLLMDRPSVAETTVPPQLQNKTIKITYTASMLAKTPDGRTINGSRKVERLIYISSLGRIFTRVARSNERVASPVARDLAPGESTLQFQEGTLIGVMPYISGAAKLTVTFDSGFQKCNFTILNGKDGGQPIKVKGLNGVVLEALSPITISDEICTIENGNAFADKQ
jgi:hypothetical protein